MAELTAILDEVFGSQPMSHWDEVFNGVHVTFGAVRGPQEVVNDPQLRANDIVVPLEGAGGNLQSHDQQSHPSAWRRQSAGKARAGNRRTQRGDSRRNWDSARTKSMACARAAPSGRQKNGRVSWFLADARG